MCFVFVHACSNVSSHPMDYDEARLGIMIVGLYGSTVLPTMAMLRRMETSHRSSRWKRDGGPVDLSD